MDTPWTNTFTLLEVERALTTGLTAPAPVLRGTIEWTCTKCSTAYLTRFLAPPGPCKGCGSIYFAGVHITAEPPQQH